jgi:hypothetical protein
VVGAAQGRPSPATPSADDPHSRPSPLLVAALNPDTAAREAHARHLHVCVRTLQEPGCLQEPGWEARLQPLATHMAAKGGAHLGRRRGTILAHENAMAYTSE